MLSYCVKQRKMTECVPGSEVIVKLKNGRDMMKCICHECGITKTKFIKKTRLVLKSILFVTILTIVTKENGKPVHFEEPILKVNRL